MEHYARPRELIQQEIHFVIAGQVMKTLRITRRTNQSRFGYGTDMDCEILVIDPLTTSKSTLESSSSWHLGLEIVKVPASAGLNSVMHQNTHITRNFS